MKLIEQTSVAILTPPGRGAVAVITVEGPIALELVERFFQAKSGTLGDRAINRIAYGRWGAEPAEDVVACRRSPNSIEVHCHGGVAAVKRIVGDLTTAGAVEEPWTIWTERHEHSPTRTAARIALSKAATQRAAAVLLDQYHGALFATIYNIIELLGTNRHEEAGALLDALLSRASFGLHLTQPWQVVIAGPPNVGKSSLINSLVGYERAIVFDQPGTTRDVVTAQTALAGWPVQLADTAGLRASDDPLESAGIERAVAQAAAADCLILLFDASKPWMPENDRLVAKWPQALVVHNKYDLLAPTTAGQTVSALTGMGMDRLIHEVVERLVPNIPAAGEAIPFTDAQVQALRIAADHLQRNNHPSAIAALQASLKL